MKIIFLDIDGVLNHISYYKSNRWEKTHSYKDDIDPLCIERLNNIIAETGANIVISSTWRIGLGVSELQEILNKKGFKGKIIDKTESFHNDFIFRGNEIYKWCNEYARKNKLIWTSKCDLFPYVIIDDDSDILYWQRENFLKIDNEVGLTDDNVKEAIWILNKDEELKLIA